MTVYDQSTFIHLDVHTEYSLLNSIFKIKDIKTACLENEYKEVGVNDFNSLHKPYTIQNSLKKDPKISPIIGVKFIVKAMFDDSFYTLLLYAKSYKGYLELVKLSTLAHTGNKEFPYVTYSELEKHSLHLVCLSGGNSGELFHLILENNKEQAYRLAEWCQQTYGKENFFIELTNHYIADEQVVNRSGLLNNLIFEYKIPTVACNDVFYWKKEHAQHRDVGFGMNPNPEGIEYSARYVMYNDEFYFKSYDEMKKAFKELLKTYPDCFENTTRIFEMCNRWELKPQKVLPEFPIEDGFTSETYFDELVNQGFQSRVVSKIKNKKRLKEYEDRLSYEKDIIKKMGFVDYHLIVQDFINWAKDKEVYRHPEFYFPTSYFSDLSTISDICVKKDFPILIGPGRGSAAGSLVCYCLAITDRDPIENKLLFERFLNPERISMPDIDVDIPNRHRHLVVKYLQNKYGYSNVSQIATFQTLGVRSIIKSVGKKVGLPYSITDELSKNVPNSIVVEKIKTNGEIELIDKPVELLSELEALDYFKERLRGDSAMQKLFQFGKVLEGLPISTGKHAAGCVICSVPIDTVVPLMEVDGVMVTQFEKHDAEDIGLLKMDLLGLLNLDIIEETISLISEYEGKDISISSIPDGDQKTFELFQAGQTANVFQFEGMGMRRLLQKMQPTQNEHLNAACALYRPGPMQFIDEYLKGRSEPQKIKYFNKAYKEVTEDTYGIMVYQEQVMSLVQKVAGFSLGEADILRRGIGKKEEKLLLENRNKFVKGGLENSDLTEKELNELYDTICRFASYGFNRSHSCAYSWISYLCGYLKANYPIYYMAACLTLYSENQDKLASTLIETKQMGISVLPPNIHKSASRFIIEKDDEGNQSIRFSFNGIKGIGNDLSKSLETIKNKDTILNIIFQIPSNLLRMDKLKYLANSGALDCFGTRKGICEFVDTHMPDIKTMIEIKENNISSFVDSFSHQRKINETEYSLFEKISLEKGRISTSLSGHPLEAIRPLINNDFSLFKASQKDFITDKKELVNINEKSISVPVFLKDIRVIKTKKTHEDMAFLTIEDENMTVDCVCFSDRYKRLKEQLIEGVPVLIFGTIQYQEGGEISFILEDIDEIHYDSSVLFLEDCSIVQKLLPALSKRNGITQVMLVDTKTNIPTITKQNFSVMVTEPMIQYFIDNNIPYQYVVLN